MNSDDEAKIAAFNKLVVAVNEALATKISKDDVLKIVNEQIRYVEALERLRCRLESVGGKSE